ncbi:hypothetical protein HYALB_00011236 [Hymenoscyphus albidus]|uniref:CorA-like transporter domain-containing protein n=1 Tax=Hymenoscyphus albidus TaxID=595503 RepID=A0A9N9Q1V3_9HELO|nr:hypothetical protein HYALB_00011236 [Hymenoscyphus albidus]
MVDKTADLFSEWETYPHNLSFSALDIDANRCHTKLGRESEKLYLFDGEESESQVLQVDPKAAIPKRSILSSSEQLLSYLGKPTTTRLFRIAQEHSWSQLLVTEELFRKLKTALKVHPEFLDVVHVFGEKITASEESFTAFFSHLSPEPSSLPGCDYEIAYNVKYVARYVRNSLKDPFSIRETGVYHNYQMEPAKSTWILLNAPDTLGESLSDAFADSKTSELLGQLRCHALILLCLSENLA